MLEILLFRNDVCRPQTTSRTFHLLLKMNEKILLIENIEYFQFSIIHFLTPTLFL